MNRVEVSMKKFLQYFKDYTNWCKDVYYPFREEHKKFFISEDIYFVACCIMMFGAGYLLCAFV